IPASAKARRAILATTESGPGGAPIPVAMPRIQTGRDEPARARSRDVTTTAEAPSLIGAHISAVSGSATIREPSTSSTVIGAVYWAHGLSAALARFFTAISARVRAARPYRARYGPSRAG